MKVSERALVRELRHQGLCYGVIRAIVPVSKSSISLWARDIQLLPEQVLALRSGRAHGREKYSETRRRQREQRHAQVYAEAEREYVHLSDDPTFMYGLALHIGEGTMSTPGSIVLTNCDPRCRIFLHPHLPEERAIEFWSAELGIGRDRFGKTTTSVSRVSKGFKTDKNPYGTCSVYYGSTNLWLNLVKWMDLSLS